MLALLIGFCGCGSNAPPLDVERHFSQVSAELAAMTETLEAIPDQFKLETTEDRQQAAQLLEQTAERFEEQALQYQQTCEVLGRARKTEGKLDDATLRGCMDADKAFQAEVRRIQRKNHQAYSRLWRIVVLVDAANAA
jgi:hypothetical protein